MVAEVQHAVAFADGEGGGNPCPVVFGADGWTDRQMQAAAAAFGHETCFVLDPVAAEADLRLRYFVPNHEMEMCVHATVAAAVVIGLWDGARVQTPLGVRAIRRPGEDAALVEQFEPQFGPVVEDVTAVLAALGAPAAALGGDRAVRAVSTARPKLMVPLRDEAALDALAPDAEALWSLCDAHQVTGVYAFTTDALGADAAARQFPLRAGYDEDPATGVAACALAAHLAPEADGRHPFAIAQGRAVGRPSLMEAEVLRERGTIVQTVVGGAAAEVGDREPLARPRA